MGKAVLLDEWLWSADGRLGRPLVPPLLPSDVPNADVVARLEEEVRHQADAVRQLKLDRGNQDAAVQRAVQSLQEAKARAAEAKELLEAFGGESSSLIKGYM